LLKIAYFSPLPPQRSGIADYSADLLPYLAEEAELALFASEPEAVSSDDLRNHFPIRRLADFPHLRWDYDIALYQMGNNLLHRDVYAMLRQYPGLTVLHDYTLHHFIACITVGEGNFPAYVRELAYSRGRNGVTGAYAMQRGEISAPLFDWPLNERVVDLSVGVLVHSNYVRQRLLAAHPKALIRKVNQPIRLPSSRDQRTARRELRLPEDAFIVVTWGQVIQEKRLDLVLQAFALFHQRHPDTLWIVVGESLTEHAHWEEMVQKSGLSNDIQQVGYVEGLEALYDYIAASDVCINLRHPTAGETSASALRTMAMGRPVIVSDVGWYAELPDDCCARIAHDGSEVEQLSAILERWYGQEETRLTIGRQARLYIARECNPTCIAREYISFMEDILLSKE
jgi:glycosyltransferase involved in cell wall biosynthesis